MLTTLEHRKRARENDDEIDIHDGLFEKKARPTTETSDTGSHRDSVISAPAASFQAREPFRFDSDDDRASSVDSDAGSNRDVSMLSDDESMDESDVYSQSPDDHAFGGQHALGQNPWAQRLQANRIPTPIVPPRMAGNHPGQIRTSFMTHVRQRHPQENNSEFLEVPSPIDEDEVPTPPSAADAAGSQLSMLSVSDIDMDTPANIPTISIDPARPAPRDSARAPTHARSPLSGGDGDDAMESDAGTVVVRKQRRRSGALSSGNSPVRAGPSTATSKRGFSMGFRADCEKCRMRVPGHMNHFIS